MQPTTQLGASLIDDQRRTLLSSPTCCVRIEWWIGSTLPIGRRPLRPSSQSALLSSGCLSSRSLGGHYCAGLDRSLNARVRLSEQTVRHSSFYVRQTSPGWVAELFFAPFPHCR